MTSRERGLAGIVVAKERRRRVFQWRSLVRSPWLELEVMIALVIIAFGGMALISATAETPEGGMSAMTIVAWLLGFFLLSFVIAIIAVIAGIGGGLIYTPIMLAFTDVNSLIVRAQGLIVAMFSGLISTGPFMRSGLGNLRLVLIACTGYGIGAFSGAQLAFVAADKMGENGEAVIRLMLAAVVGLVGAYLVMGGKKLEWPEVKKVDGFTRRLNIPLPYYEHSLGKVIDYQVKCAWGGMLVMMGVGLMSGFFGMGAGWATVPALNLVMGVPLKVAAACSGVILGMGDCIGVWPYIIGGAIIPLFAAPWLAGQVIGGLLGAKLLVSIKSGPVRYILIGIMFFTTYSLVTRGLSDLDVIGDIPFAVTGTIFVVIMGAVLLAAFGRFPKLIRR